MIQLFRYHTKKTNITHNFFTTKTVYTGTGNPKLISTLEIVISVIRNIDIYNYQHFGDITNSN